MGARARRAGAVAARHVPFPRRAPEPDHRGRCRSPPNYAPDQSVQRTRPRSACRPPSPWLQNRALCMHAALSQSQTQTRLNAALAPPPGPHGRRSRMHWSPSRESRCRQWASAPQVLPVEAAARYLPLFIFLSRQGSTTSGRVSVAARLDARIDAPTSPARPAARVQCQASECSRDHQYMFGFCHCGHHP